MNRPTISFLLLLVIFFSCTDKSKEMEKDFLTKGLERIEIAKKYEWIVILPGSGCQGCIQEGEYFLKENIENEKYCLS